MFWIFRYNRMLQLSLVLLIIQRPCFAIGIPTIILKSSRAGVLNDGRDYHEVIADIRDGTGAYAPDGTTVSFQTTLGIFAGSSDVRTRSGSARIRLTSMTKGTANVTASVAGGGVQRIQLIFTDDPQETYQGNGYLTVQATGALVYLPLSKVIDASGKLASLDDNSVPGASMVFRNIEIFADHLQIDCSANIVRATGRVHVVRAGKRLNCSRLFLPLVNGDGFAVTDKGKRTVGVKVIASTLETQVQEKGVNTAVFAFTETADIPQYIIARQIRLFPGDKLQFNRPKIFQEGVQIVSMPFYSLNLYSTTLITEQVLNVGTQGIGMDVPLYYDLSPVSTGIFHVRHGDQNGRSSFATRPGWSLDMVQDYNSRGGAKRYTGELGLTGISRDDWGMRWSHNQDFADNTLGSFFMDMPQHRAIYASTSLTKITGPVRLGLNLSGNRNLSGLASSGTEADVFVETLPKKVGNTGYNLAVGSTAGSVRSVVNGQSVSTFSEGLQTRLFSNPFKLDKSTSITNYFTIGNTWASQGRGGPSYSSSVSMMRTLGQGASLQLTYDFSKQPQLINFGGYHRISGSAIMNGGSKWNMLVYGSTMLDARNASLVGDFSYSFLPRWRLTAAATVQQILTSSFKDYSLGFARSIGGRDFVLSYSTFSHRFFFDLQGNRF